MVLDGAYTKHADVTVSATTLRARRDERIACDTFARLRQLVLENFDHVIGLDLTRLAVDGCRVKAPNGGDNCQAPGFVEAPFLGFLSSHGFSRELVDPFPMDLERRAVVNR